MTPDIMENIRTRIDQLTKSNDEDVAKRNKITPEFMKLWIAKYSADSKVQSMLRGIDDLQDQVLVKHQLKEIHFKLPENLTRESYLQIARKTQAAVRHSIWKHMNAQGLTKISNEEMDEISDRIKNTE